MKKIGVAIIGCGAIHHRHAQAIINIDGAELIAVVDTNQAKGEQSAQQYGCLYYVDYREILQNEAIDIVHICTPHYQHKAMIIDALQAGKHVFCEKPVVLNSTEIDEVIQAEKSTTKTVGVCYQNRFNLTTQALLQSIKAGDIGAVKGVRAFLTWQRLTDYYQQSGWRGKADTEGGSLLINQAIHTLDLMQLIGGGVDKLKSKIDTTWLADTIETEDSAMISLQMNNGATGLFYGSNNYTRNASLFLEVHGESGIARLHEHELTITNDKETQVIHDYIDNKDVKDYWGNSHYTEST